MADDGPDKQPTESHDATEVSLDTIRADFAFRTLIEIIETIGLLAKEIAAGSDPGLTARVEQVGMTLKELHKRTVRAHERLFPADPLLQGIGMGLGSEPPEID